jgi:hypothetical protein
LTGVVSVERQTKYAYLVTLLGVVLATITTAYTALRSFMVSQRFGSYPSGNFTRTRPVGNFTGARQFANMNPYGGFVNNFAILVVIIALVGVVWLGLSLRKSKSRVT